MIIVGLLEWWYTRGAGGQMARARESILSVYDYFSIDLLLKTLFSPFRQISAGGVRGPLAVQMRAFFDRLFSRLVGAFIRTFMIIFGSIALVIVSLMSIVRVVGWLIMPVLPIVGLMLTLSGWVLPWKV